MTTKNYKIQPCGNRLACIVRQIKTEGNILLPDIEDAGLEPHGEVIAMGPDVNPKHFAIGDKVLFNPGQALTFKQGKDKIWIFDASGVFGKYIE